ILIILFVKTFPRVSTWCTSLLTAPCSPAYTQRHAILICLAYMSSLELTALMSTRIETCQCITTIRFFGGTAPRSFIETDFLLTDATAGTIWTAEAVHGDANAAADLRLANGTAASAAVCTILGSKARRARVGAL